MSDICITFVQICLWIDLITSNWDRTTKNFRNITNMLQNISRDVMCTYHLIKQGFYYVFINFDCKTHLGKTITNLWCVAYILLHRANDPIPYIPTYNIYPINSLNLVTCQFYKIAFNQVFRNKKIKFLIVKLHSQ